MLLRDISAAVFAAVACAATAHAQTASQTGFEAGDVVIRLAGAGVVPLTPGSHIDTLGGNVGVTATPAPEVDLSYYITDDVSIQAIAASTRHEISANNTGLSGVLGSKIDLASTYVLPPAIVTQYNFAPHAVLDPYVGLGLDLLFPYDVHENQLVLPNIGRVVEKIGLSNAIGPVFDLGLNYHVTGRWFVNLDYKQILDRVYARIHTALGLVKANVELDPAVLSAGISYRF